MNAMWVCETVYVVVGPCLGAQHHSRLLPLSGSGVSFVSIQDIGYKSEEDEASNLHCHWALFVSPELQQPFAIARQPGLLS